MISLGILLLANRIYGDACSEQCMQQNGSSGYQNIGKMLNGASNGIGMSSCSIQPSCALATEGMPQMGGGMPAMTSVMPSMGQQTSVPYQMVSAQQAPPQYIQPGQMMGGGDCGSLPGGGNGGSICQQQPGSSVVPGGSGGSPWQSMQQPSPITIETYCPPMSNPGNSAPIGGNGGGMPSNCYQGSPMQQGSPQQPQMVYYNPPMQPSQGNYMQPQPCTQQPGQALIGGGMGSVGGGQYMPSECMMSQMPQQQQQPSVMPGGLGSGNGTGQFISPCTMAALQGGNSMMGGANSECISAGMMPNMNTLVVGNTVFPASKTLQYASSSCAAENASAKGC